MSTHPRCQFVPPFLVDRVATGTLEIDDEIRAHRESLRATRRGPGGPPAGVSSAATWSVHTAEHLRKLPGPLVRAAGAPASGDASVDDAYTHTEETLDFYAHGLLSKLLRRPGFSGHRQRALRPAVRQRVLERQPAGVR